MRRCKYQDFLRRKSRTSAACLIAPLNCGTQMEIYISVIASFVTHATPRHWHMSHWRSTSRWFLLICLVISFLRARNSIKFCPSCTVLLFEIKWISKVQIFENNIWRCCKSSYVDPIQHSHCGCQNDNIGCMHDVPSASPANKSVDVHSILPRAFSIHFIVLGFLVCCIILDCSTLYSPFWYFTQWIGSLKRRTCGRVAPVYLVFNWRCVNKGYNV